MTSQPGANFFRKEEADAGMLRPRPNKKATPRGGLFFSAKLATDLGGVMGFLLG